MRHTEPLKTTMRCGWIVLAKLYEGQLTPVTYANRTQAQKAASKFNGYMVQYGRPFLVRFN